MKPTVEFSDFDKLDLRVAKVKKVEEISGADKLYKLTLDVGKVIGKRIICAGLKPYYSKEELMNKKIIYFSNLAPRNLKGVESEGMLLAASSDDKVKVVFLTPEKDIEVGSKIS